jgi:signal transduction histidine kinase
MRGKWPLPAVSVALFLAFSYSVWGVTGLISASLLALIILLSVSSPRRAGMIFYFFLGFLAGFMVAIVIGVKTNASGWESTVLLSLPLLGALLALLYGRKTDYMSWPVFGFRYRL